MRQVWRETRTAFERERYTVGDRTVDLSGAMAAMRTGTRLHLPEELERSAPPDPRRRTTGFAVTGESTLAAVVRLAGEEAGSGAAAEAGPEAEAGAWTDAGGGAAGRVGALNFASARNPGGGVANGARAQEESLVRSSALYASLTACPEFYEHHRAERGLLYTDRVIHSPGVPVFRDDRGGWLTRPVSADFLTCAAPNRRMIERNRTGEAERIPGVLVGRARGVLAVAAHAGVERLVLGAWGGGVFANRPSEVAEAFAEHLRGEFEGVFAQVVFAVLGRDEEVRRPFREAFAAERWGRPQDRGARPPAGQEFS
ncbi:TIGR02452 family protein [Nocardiopsis aegyptia]